MGKKRATAEIPAKTGWPPGLLQDDSKELSQWFASRIDARWVLRKSLAQPEEKVKQSK